MAVSTIEMREFALQCLRWSEEAVDAGQRDLMVRVAKSWMNTAYRLDHHVNEGRFLAPDLQHKLD